MSLLGNVHRILLPTRGGTNSQLPAQLLNRVADGSSFEVTVMQVVGQPVAAGAVVHTEAILTDVPCPQVVIDRARYTAAGPIVLESEVRPVRRRAFFGHDVDEILRRAPCPVAVITR